MAAVVRRNRFDSDRWGDTFQQAAYDCFDTLSGSMYRETIK
jgi:hypothetical protein